MRYINREMQRHFAHILKEAEVEPHVLTRVARALEKNNNSWPSAFMSFFHTSKEQVND